MYTASDYLKDKQDYYDYVVEQSYWELKKELAGEPTDDEVYARADEVLNEAERSREQDEDDHDQLLEERRKDREELLEGRKYDY